MTVWIIPIVLCVGSFGAIIIKELVPKFKK